MKNIITALMVLLALVAVSGCRHANDHNNLPYFLHTAGPEEVDIQNTVTLHLLVEDNVCDQFGEVVIDDSEFGDGIVYSTTSETHKATVTSALNPDTDLYEYTIDIVLQASAKEGQRLVDILNIRFIRDGKSLETLLENDHQWEMKVNNSFDIVYSFEGSPTGSQQNYQFGDAIHLIDDPVLYGHKFVGWIDNATGEPFAETTMPNHDIGLRALWKDEFVYELNRSSFDGSGMDINIRVFSKSESDPFDPGYTRDDKIARQDLQLAIEHEYNVKINYLGYQELAEPERVQAIIGGHLSGNRIGDIYQVSSQWLPQLADAQALRALYDTVAQDGIFSDFDFEPSAINQDITTYKGKVYAYNFGTRRPDYFLFYNASMVDALGLKDPAQMWHDHEWNWTNFKSFLDQAEQNTLFSGNTGYYQLSGQSAEYTLGFLAAQGGKFIDPLTGSLTWASDDSIGIINDLRGLNAKGYIDSVSYNFKNGKAIFTSGSMSYLGNPYYYSDDFEIGVVPYPVQDGDELSLSKYTVPVSGDACFAVANVTNGQNGLSSSVLFNILDDLSRGQLSEDPEGLLPDEAYREYLESKFGKGLYVDTIMSVRDQKYLYFDKIFMVSLDVGVGTQYGPFAMYPLFNKIIFSEAINPLTELEDVRPYYEAVLDDWK